MNGKRLVGFSVVTAIAAIGIFTVIQELSTSKTDSQTVADGLQTPHPESIADPVTSVEPSVRAGNSDAFEVVHGMKVRKDRNCTIERRYIDIGDGTVVEGFSCVPNRPSEPGVYDSYDDETLAGMSYSDSLAAEVLGKRLAEEDPDRARRLLIRSVALKPQNTQPILWLASAYYGLVSENGVPTISEMSQKYLLTRIAEELGTPGAATGIRQLLVEAGFQERDFMELEVEVSADLTRIRNIQFEVTGMSDLPEIPL